MRTFFPAATGLRAERGAPLRAVRLLFVAAATTAAAAAQSDLYTVEGELPFQNLGRALDRAGDVNGDGAPDWVVGSSAGARVHSGTDGALLYDFPAPPGNTLLGWSVAGAGDVDRDGFADLLVGAQLDDTSFPSAGRAWLFSGRDGSVLRTHDGEAPSAFLGSALCGLGDLDGDGHPDYAASAPGAGVVRVFSGHGGAQIFAVAGPEIGFGCDVDRAGDVDGDAVDDLVVGVLQSPGAARIYSGASGALIRVLSGPPGSLGFGERVAGVGDLDGDGRGDVAVGARFEDVGDASGAGRVHVYSGASGAHMYALGGARAGIRFGSALAAAGDVNGDGAPDIVVGAPAVQGGFDGSLVNQEPTQAQVFSGPDGALLYTHGGELSIDLFGTSVAGIGDVDGDGLADLAVGAVLDDHGANSAGRVRVIGGAGCPQPRRYCASAPHSRFGLRARIGSLGSVSVSQDELTLYVVDGVPDRMGLFFHGSAQTYVPAGDGFRCVALPLHRIALVATNPAGIATLDLAPLAGSPFTPGTTVFLQYAFLDPAGPGGTGFNYSDALVAHFCP